MNMKVQLLVGGLVLAVVCGCGAKDGQPAAQATATAEHDHEHGHDHPSEGPHHGTLVELGSHEYHAEVVHTKDSVTVYILDAHAEKAVPVDAADLTINVMHDGKPSSSSWRRVLNPMTAKGSHPNLQLRMLNWPGTSMTPPAPPSYRSRSTPKPIVAKFITTMTTITNTNIVCH